MEPLEIPNFANESEEAKWWFDHRDRLDDDFLEAAQHGRLERGSALRIAGLPNHFLSLDPSDVELAREQASRRGLPYEAYLAQILHEALLREAAGS